MDYIMAFWNSWTTLLIRALLVIGPLFLVFWVIKPAWVKKLRIHQPRHKDVITLKEMPRFIFGLSVYLIPGVALVFSKKTFGYSPMYTDISQYGWVYFAASFLIFAIIIDTWAFWSHYLMHRISAFKKIHQIHHQSYNVTPISAYSLHYIEAVLNVIPYAIIIFLIPWHPTALLIFGIFGMFYNSYLHLGYDLPANWKNKIPGASLLLTSSHHSIHHQQFRGNYAAYFVFWDRLMKTEVKN